MLIWRGLPAAPSDNQSTFSNQQSALDSDPRLHLRSFRYDDDAVPDVVALAIGIAHARLVDEPHAVPDPGVLVDDHAIEDDIAPDAERCRAGRHLFLVEIRAEQDRSRDAGAALDVCPNADDRVPNFAAIQIAALGDDRGVDAAVVG